MKSKKAIIYFIIFIVALLVGLWGFYRNQFSTEVRDIGVDANNELLRHFQEIYPQKEIVLCAYEDISNDDLKDLLIIYKKEKRKNAMVAIIDKSGKYAITEEVPAPLENQRIEFKNIDEEGLLEFIVSGSKEGRYGYAIFRLEDMKLLDLFGEGMEDCC
ncbi:Cys-Cys-COOH (seleno)protein SaoC [Clostridiaceae bacterium 35-E11]